MCFSLAFLAAWLSRSSRTVGRRISSILFACLFLCLCWWRHISADLHLTLLCKSPWSLLPHWSWVGTDLSHEKNVITYALWSEKEWCSRVETPFLLISSHRITLTHSRLAGVSKLTIEVDAFFCCASISSCKTIEAPLPSLLILNRTKAPLQISRRLFGRVSGVHSPNHCARFDNDRGCEFSSME